MGAAAADFTWNNELFKLAEEHCISMANANELSHGDVMDRLNELEFCDWDSFAENVAFNMLEGDAAINGAVTDWAESVEGHRENTLGSYAYGACAIVSVDATGKVFLTAKFMNCGTEEAEESNNNNDSGGGG